MIAVKNRYGITKEVKIGFSWTMLFFGALVPLFRGEDKEIEVFNEDNFKKENEELYKKYLEKKIKKGRSGYVKITLKENE